MKSILKTIDEIRGLDYNEMFNSAKNFKIHRKLVPELCLALNISVLPVSLVMVMVMVRDAIQMKFYNL
jgi:hypothetical protein